MTNDNATEYEDGMQQITVETVAFTYRQRGQRGMLLRDLSYQVVLVGPLRSL